MPAMNVGDVIAVPLEGGLHGLVQIVRVDPDGPIVLVLDFEGEIPPVAAIEKLQPLKNTFGSYASTRVPAWSGGSVVANVPSKATGVVLTGDEWTAQGCPAGAFVVAASWAPEHLASMVFYGGEYTPLAPDADETAQMIHRVMNEDVRKALVKRRAPKRRAATARRPAVVEGLASPPPPSESMVAVVTDDDGVIVAASAAALALRYREQAFDYEFPVALLEGINADEIAAWQTEVEGEVSVTVTIAPDLPPDATPCGRIQILESDTLLVLSYATYTFAAGAENGLPKREVARFGIAPGVYACGVVRASDGVAGFTLVLAPTTAVRKRVRALAQV